MKIFHKKSETADWHTRTHDGSYYQNCQIGRTDNNKTFGTKSFENWNVKSQNIANEQLKGVGHGRLTMVGGQAAGLRGNSHKVDLRQRGGAQVATTGVLVHRGETRRPNARGIRAKPQTNTTAGEIQKTKNPISTILSSLIIILILSRSHEFKFVAGFSLTASFLSFRNCLRTFFCMQKFSRSNTHEITKKNL